MKYLASACRIPRTRLAHILVMSNGSTSPRDLHTSAVSGLAAVDSRPFNPTLFHRRSTQTQEEWDEWKSAKAASKIGSRVTAESMEEGAPSTISGPSGVTVSVGGEENAKRLAKISRDFRSTSSPLIVFASKAQLFSCEQVIPLRYPLMRSSWLDCKQVEGTMYTERTMRRSRSNNV